MLIDCYIHGPAGVLIYSRDLLEVDQDGKVQDLVTVELKDTPEEEAFFRFNVSAAEAAKLPIVNGCIPFDVAGLMIMKDMPQMCMFCFAERRMALMAQQTRGT